MVSAVGPGVRVAYMYTWRFPLFVDQQRYTDG